MFCDYIFMDKKEKRQSIVSLVVLSIAVLLGWIFLMVRIVEDDSNLSKLDKSVNKANELHSSFIF
ncbi:hypothetical protein C4577_04335 [Candidatus Parcubacteria bacterium]|nr:MAG: hypothetical protein C4577_04335 [Candidatus Parcubacteria bacterium]